jgi:hypothetical protein
MSIEECCVLIRAKAQYAACVHHMALFAVLSISSTVRTFTEAVVVKAALP